MNNEFISVEWVEGIKRFLIFPHEVCIKVMDTKYFQNTSARMESKLDESGMVRDLPFAVVHKVCMLLNDTNLGSSYKMLAGVMGYEVNAIKTFGLKENPADNLLQHWGTRGDSTNGKLIKHLARIQRSDVIDVLYGRESRLNNQEPREVVRPNMRLPMVRDMEYLLRYKICLELNLPQEISGNDYRMFAEKVGIRKPERTEIFRKENPMEEVLTWWAAKNEATVNRMKEILLEMGRQDVWGMLENSEADLCQSLNNNAVI